MPEKSGRNATDPASVLADLEADRRELNALLEHVPSARTAENFRRRDRIDSRLERIRAGMRIKESGRND